MSQAQDPVFRIQVRSHQDPRAGVYLQDAHLLGFTQIDRIDLEDLYFIQGSLDSASLESLVHSLLQDPITQTAVWEEVRSQAAGSSHPSVPAAVIEVAYRPGVTDPVADEILRASGELGFLGIRGASTGTRFTIHTRPGQSVDLGQLAQRLLANPVIQRCQTGLIQPVFPLPAAAVGTCEIIPITHMDDEQLMALSQDRRAALDLAEMRAIQAYCRSENRDLTDIEFEMLAQTWSEHCVHKTFKARITILPPLPLGEGRGEGASPPPSLEEVKAEVSSPPLPLGEGRGEGSSTGQAGGLDSLMRTYIRAATEAIAAPWVISAFKDNAGIIQFGDDYEVSFKVETHNHPSAIEPFGGANTGVGGVIRDVIGVSAKPIAATDVLCFGPQDAGFEDLPAGVLHPRRISSGVVAGVQDYGNKIGIPTVSGAILYDPGFTANPLVFCGCVGLAPRGKHRSTPQPGDRVLVLGGHTGRDGLRGATFSSQTMDAQTGEVAGASVQIGAPIVEKGLIDVIVRARDLGLYTAITDCGAGGLSSAVGEMAGETGAVVDLAGVRLKYPGLVPWEIWLSEAQERMVLAVPPAHMEQMVECCQLYGVEWTDIGEFTQSGRLVVTYGVTPVLDLSVDFLHHGIPQKHFTAVLPSPVYGQTQAGKDAWQKLDYAQTLLNLLSHPDIASKEKVIRIYDHEIQGGTLVKPLTGAQSDGPSDACVLKPAGTPGNQAIALSAGINPQYGKVDPYRMAHSVVDEAVRNVVAVGADPDRIAILDNFCWGDPSNPETMGTLLEAARGCYDAALLHQTPFISGKDSLNNEYAGTDGKRHAIPPTLLISALGILPDLNQAVTLDLKQAGNILYRVGEFQPGFGGSHLCLVEPNLLPTSSQEVPPPSSLAPQVYRRLHQAVRLGLVRAAHDLSEGGLAVSAAEMCIAGRLGLDLELQSRLPGLDLFGETNGCLLVEIQPENLLRFETLFNGLPWIRLGAVTHHPLLRISLGSQPLISVHLDRLISSWKPV